MNASKDTEGREHSDFCGFAGGPILPNQSCFCANDTKTTFEVKKIDPKAVEKILRICHSVQSGVHPESDWEVGRSYLGKEIERIIREGIANA